MKRLIEELDLLLLRTADILCKLINPQGLPSVILDTFIR